MVGYQHLSAMGRDPFGGRATNLMLGIKPGDIYQDVADRCSWRLARDAGDHSCREARARPGEASRNDQFWARQLAALPFRVSFFEITELFCHFVSAFLKSLSCFAISCQLF
jgi:hypothetical protein